MGRETNKEIIQKIKEFKENIKRKYGVEKLIVFGSAARTNFKKFNDIDLIVVARKKEKQLHLLPKLYHEWHIKQKIDFPVDFVLFDLKTFKKMSKRITIVKQALEEGIEI